MVWVYNFTECQQSVTQYLCKFWCLVLSLEQVNILEADRNLCSLGRHPGCPGRGTKTIDVQCGHPLSLHSRAAGPISHLTLTGCKYACSFVFFYILTT